MIRYRARGAVREVGKALGLPEDVTAALAGLVWGWSTEGVRGRGEELNLNLDDRRLRADAGLARQLIGTPRHLSQHPGGFVLTQDRLDELVPIEPAAMENRQVIEWDKDDIDALKFMKVDVLASACSAACAAPSICCASIRACTRPRHHPARGPRDLRDDPQGRHGRHVPDREPGADGDAAAPEAEDLL